MSFVVGHNQWGLVTAYTDSEADNNVEQEVDDRNEEATDSSLDEEGGNGNGAISDHSAINAQVNSRLAEHIILYLEKKILDSPEVEFNIDIMPTGNSELDAEIARFWCETDNRSFLEAQLDEFAQVLRIKQCNVVNGDPTRRGLWHHVVYPDSVPKWPRVLEVSVSAIPMT
ncbi:hypothetical protein Q8F55_001679 [Vanrija albida]|uniref:Uncharacterized protein n=1 Tax=Vanrija albida TaxID=181172 RepID=A0ABR3Q8C5_9TREE